MDEANPEPQHLCEQLGLRADEHGQVDQDLLSQRDGRVVPATDADDALQQLT